jgi:hypothetical protein
MTTPTFAATLKSVEHKTPGAAVLSMLNLYNTEVPELRQFLRTDSEVPAPIRTIASSTSRWNRLLNKSVAWRSPDSLPARRLALARSIVVRVLRTPRAVFDADRAKNIGNPNWTERPADWDGGASFTNVRMLTALVGLHQLLWLDIEDKPTSTPYTNLRHFAVPLNLAPEGKSVKARLVGATALGSLRQERPSAKRQCGVWLVRSLNDRRGADPVTGKHVAYFWPKDAPLTAAEEAVAVALAEGDLSNFAAALLLNADHLAFHYGELSAAAWWTLLRFAAEPFTPRLSMSNERLVHRVTSVASLDTFVSDEARARHAAKLSARTEEATKNTREVKLTGLVYSHLAFDSLTPANVDSWQDVALASLRAIPPERRYIATELVAHLEGMLPQRLTEPRQIGGVLSYLEGNLTP